MSRSKSIEHNERVILNCVAWRGSNLLKATSEYLSGTIAGYHKFHRPQLWGVLPITKLLRTGCQRECQGNHLHFIFELWFVDTRQGIQQISICIFPNTIRMLKVGEFKVQSIDYNNK